MLSYAQAHVLKRKAAGKVSRSPWCRAQYIHIENPQFHLNLYVAQARVAKDNKVERVSYSHKSIHTDSI